jgi:hypothetical protein
MTRKLMLALVAGLALIAFVAIALAQDEPAEAEEKSEEKKEEVQFDYIGAKKCKICHKDIYESWEQTIHANAWETLKPEEQKNEKCVGCHSTGTTPKGDLLVGVQCEACHGPGSEYKAKSIMESRELSLANGLIIPDSSLCVSCHNEESPTFKGFNYREAHDNEKAIHVLPVKT